ncbi:chemotaxis protein [Salinimonas sp. HHU 13199]|uniref:Chemotaxis protein n=1 Tax=Salinimonas profundi TaxID=2729140 RepID=A0ABR8LMR3_9ALTE|nr:chemotaxis protein [Salinimonas profundi]MBD3587017.1 chemotaxis protein [Salinimonas profundi]
MKFDSIKSRLLLMLLICVLGMALLVISQHFFTQKLVSLHQQRELLLRLGQDLLQMRRHEKDFLLRHEIDYYHRFTRRAEIFNQRLARFVPMMKEHDYPDEQAGQLAQSIFDYQRLFNQVVQLQTEIGLTKTLGLKGELASVEQQLTPVVGSDEVLAEARVAAREYMLFNDQQSSKRFYVLTDKLVRRSDSGDEKILLDAYIQLFTRLATANKAMGITHNEGLRGQFRQQAHDVEAQLEHIDTAFQPLINNQTEQVRVYSLSIALTTSVVLILLLVKSFATFHSAFANFVMFFYRCKRQYQRIDPKQLGFAEFKSLAELANEMVESRRNMELELAETQAALRQQHRDNQQNDSSHLRENNEISPVRKQ